MSARKRSRYLLKDKALRDELDEHDDNPTTAAPLLSVHTPL
jgi:hypothetical protein